MSGAASTEGRYARKREEQSCIEISCMLHSLSYLAPYCYSTNFTQLVDLVVSCEARELQVFVENASRTLLKGQWLTLSKHLEHGSRSLFLKGFKRHLFSVFNLMADECTDITAVPELPVFCHWEEDGTPVKSILDIVPLKKADAESIYLALV